MRLGRSLGVALGRYHHLGYYNTQFIVIHFKMICMFQDTWKHVGPVSNFLGAGLERNKY